MKPFILCRGGFSKTNHFLDFSATNGNVLLGMIAATPPTSVPEASTYGLFLAGMLALVAVLRLQAPRG